MFYLRVLPEGQRNQIWQIDENQARRVDVTNAENGPGTFFRRLGRRSIWEALREDTGWFSQDATDTGPFHKLELPPGYYYPRIARPLNGSQVHVKSPSGVTDPNAVALGIGQAHSLLSRLEQICQIVHPAPETLGTYGHEIRNLLILASTEVEAHWRGILRANGNQKGKFNTNDYVKLLPIMRLDEYVVGFRSFPWLPPISPFSRWSSDSSTQSLVWYDAYNKVKHDRDDKFRDARLEHAFSAVTACIIMLAAQYTPSVGLGGRSDLAVFFDLIQVPRWSSNESYISSILAESEEWKPVSHFNLALA